MTVTLRQRRWASAGLALTMSTFIVTLSLLVTYASKEIKVRQTPGTTWSDGSYKSYGVCTSTATIIFLCTVLLVYGRAIEYCCDVVSGTEPYQPFKLEQAHAGWFNRLLVATAGVSLIIATSVNLHVFGFEPVTPLPWIVYVHCCLYLVPLAVLLGGGMVVAIIGGMCLLFHFLGSKFVNKVQGCWRGCQKTWTEGPSAEALADAPPLMLITISNDISTITEGEEPGTLRSLVCSMCKEKIDLRHHRIRKSLEGHVYHLQCLEETSQRAEGQT